MLLVELDRFRMVSDALGHETADALLAVHATEADGKWFVQSLHAHEIGWMPAQPDQPAQP